MNAQKDSSTTAKLGDKAIEKKGWFIAHKWLLLRRLSQISVFTLYLIGPIAGIWLIKGNLSSSLLLDTIPLTDPLLLIQMYAAGVIAPLSSVLIGSAIVAGFYILVGGRSYCSWVCPVNIVTDTSNWLRVKFKIKPSSQIKRSMRYWVLAMTIIVSFATGTLAYEFVNPVSIVHRSIIFGFGLMGYIILIIFLYDLIIATRGWCSHLCPMGAFYGLIGKGSLIRIRAENRDNCDSDCKDCFKICPEPQVITPALRGKEKNKGPVILSGDCTNCGRCIDICPESVFKLGTRFNNK